MVHAHHPKLRWRLRSGRSKIQASPSLEFNGKQKNLGVVVYTCHPGYNRKTKRGELLFRPPQVKSKTLSPKEPEQKG
jgi:hypothetical protein